MEIILASPRGFCAGVERAILIVEEALKKYGTPLYVRHEIVHNRSVVDALKKKGVIFVEELEEVPDNAIAIFSAHGVAKSVYDEANKKNLIEIDATCPLVKKVHKVISSYHKKNIQIVLIGHKNHPEIIGTMGQLEKGKITLVESVADIAHLTFNEDTPLAYTTQTTLSIYETKDIIDALKKKYPDIIGPEQGDLCYATTNRQDAVVEIAKQVDLFIIIGSKNSSNSNRLRELAADTGNIPAYLIDNVHEIDETWFNDAKTSKADTTDKIIGISSGASAPDYLVQELVQWFEKKYDVININHYITSKENVVFKLPSMPELSR